MPPAGGLSPRTPTWKTMTPVGARTARRHRRRVFPKQVSKGLSPFWPPGILPLCFLTFTQLSLVADDCKKLLVESMNAFLEPIRDRRKALDKKTPSSSGTCSKPATRQRPAPGPRGIWMRSRKAELYLLERQEDASGGGGLSPGPRPGKQ